MVNGAGALVAALGALLCLVSAISLFRLSSALARMAAVAKASTLGLALVLLGGVIIHPTIGFALKSALIIAFLWIGTPVSGHLIGRAGYRQGQAGPLRVDEIAQAQSRPGKRPASGAEPAQGDRET